MVKNVFFYIPRDLPTLSFLSSDPTSNSISPQTIKDLIDRRQCINDVSFFMYYFFYYCEINYIGSGKKIEVSERGKILIILVFFPTRRYFTNGKAICVKEKLLIPDVLANSENSMVFWKMFEQCNAKLCSTLFNF